MGTTKSFATRDSAVAVLRKMGIAKEAYAKFVSQDHDGRYVVEISNAEKSLAKPVPVPVPVPVAKPATRNAARAEKLRDIAAMKQAERDSVEVANPVVDTPPEGGESQSKYIVRLIDLGHTNREIFGALREHYNIGADKKWYPSWYRARERRLAKAAEAN